jgi:hypothetical protein
MVTDRVVNRHSIGTILQLVVGTYAAHLLLCKIGQIRRRDGGERLVIEEGRWKRLRTSNRRQLQLAPFVKRLLHPNCVRCSLAVVLDPAWSILARA